MEPLNHLVIALHDRENMGSAMAKTARLAEGARARMTVVQTCWDPVSDPSTHFPQETVESVASRLKATELNNLSAAVARYRLQGSDLRAHVIWSRQHAPAVAAFCEESGADLVVIPQHPNGARKRLRLPEPLKLAGLAKIPLLVCAEAPWPSEVDMLVLMDAADAAHEALNRRLVAAAGALAAPLSGRLHLAAVYRLPRSALSSEAEGSRYRTATETRLRDALQKIDDDSGQPVESVHVLEGEVAQRADQLATSFETPLIVLGTAARRGMDRLLLGNTAEALLLQETDRDLLLVPDR